MGVIESTRPMNERPKRVLARRLRRDPSGVEAPLWRLLRGRRLADLKFRRQVPLGRYVVDFVCFRHRLIVEADGPFHDPEHDRVRDAWLASQGFRVLRFPNDRIRIAPHEVTATILSAVNARVVQDEDRQSW